MLDNVNSYFYLLTYLIKHIQKVCIENSWLTQSKVKNTILYCSVFLYDYKQKLCLVQWVEKGERQLWTERERGREKVRERKRDRRVKAGGEKKYRRQESAVAKSGWTDSKKSRKTEIFILPKLSFSYVLDLTF